jgi:hypothetical protein
VTAERVLGRVRFWLIVMMVGLVLSGGTAFPLDHGSAALVRIVDGLPGWLRPGAAVTWLHTIRGGIHETWTRYPFVAYGTDWLAFAHLVIAVAFIGPIREPLRNVWVVQWGLVACAGIVPLALICGPLRGIPFWWSLIDMSFGVFGALPLLLAYRWIRRLPRTEPGVAVA